LIEPPLLHPSGGFFQRVSSAMGAGSDPRSPDRRFGVLLSSGAVARCCCCCSSRRCSLAGPENLAAQRRSSLL